MRKTLATTLQKNRGKRKLTTQKAKHPANTAKNYTKEETKEILNKKAWDELESEGMLIQLGDGMVKATHRGIIEQQKIYILMTLRS